MSSMKIQMKGVDSLKKKLKAIPSAVELELRKEIFEHAKEIKDEAVKEVERPKSGRLYRKKYRGTDNWYSWRASSPGEAPAKRTGENMRKIVVKKSNRAGKPSSRIVAPGIFRMLEKGLSIGGQRQVLPRPLFGPIVAKHKKKYRDRLEAVIAKALKVAVRRR